MFIIIFILSFIISIAVNAAYEICDLSEIIVDNIKVNPVYRMLV